MTVTLILGTQWGDEGKGKVVDYYAKTAEYIVRFQGGNNAGHTIKVGENVYKLHITPSGVIQGKTGVIGNGVVIDPEILLEEISELKKRNINPNLLISDRAHIIMPYHKILDGAKERSLGTKKIGTTKRGIGPCYSDKVARNGIRAIDLIDKNRLQKRLESIIPIQQKLLETYGIPDKISQKEILKTYTEYGKQLQPYITTTHIILNKAIKQNKHILLEGAQGTMLDVDFGTYPFTTSSHVIAGGATIGTGISPKHLNDIIGIVKAYTTRVGEGPLPTEQKNNIGNHLQEKGHEFGTTTNRPRRCGWLDLVVVGHSCMLSGITKIALTKLDVLDGIPNLQICTKYKLHDELIDYIPADIDDLQHCQPIYETFPGWDSISSETQTLSYLPKNAQTYIQFIEKTLEIPITLISIGPDRTQTIEV